MKLPNPINKIDQTTKPTNRRFYSTLVSSLLTLMLCTTLTPKTQHHTANYIDPRERATNQTAQDSDRGYNWFY